MQIYVTQKLAKAAELPVVEEDTRADPLFSWIAGWYTTYGGGEPDTLIATNKAARFVVGIYPVTEEELPGIFDAFPDILRHALQADNCNPALIKKYLADLARPRFLLNSGRENATRLNGIARLCRENFPVDLARAFDGERCDLIGMRMNSILEAEVQFDRKKREKYPAQSLGDALASHYGLPRFFADALEIECTLDLKRYRCIRRIVVPEDLPLPALHGVLQLAFFWNDYHLHAFQAGSTRFVQSEEDLYNDSDVLEEDYTVSDLFRSRTHAVYEYDFGDSWEVDLHLVNSHKGYEKELPRQLFAEGAAPPEDCGGVWGFNDMLTVLSNPEDPNYQQMREWAAGWSPELNEMQKGERVLPLFF